HDALPIYPEAFERHRILATRLAELDRLQQETLDRRNTVDRLDADVEEARQLFGTELTALTAAICDRASADLAMLSKAVDGVDRDKQGFLVGRLLWGLVHAPRVQALADAVRQSEDTFTALGMRWQPWQEHEGMLALREQLADLNRRVELACKVLKYREALRALQKSPSFESIARRRLELAEEVSQNSARLWSDWVQLAPTRLTPAQRRDIADYAAVLQMITGLDGNRVHSSVKRKAQELQSKVTSFFSCWAITSLSARGRVPLEPGYFDLVVIDEASQCDIASAFPLLYRGKRSVIIGDPMQLRHISALTKPRDSDLLQKHGLVENRLGWMYSVNSLFDLAASIAASENIINLRDHHRSHADIIGFSNQTFYEARLRVATR